MIIKFLKRILTNNPPSNSDYFPLDNFFMRYAPFRIFMFAFFIVGLICLTVAIGTEIYHLTIGVTKLNMRKEVTVQAYQAIVHPPDSREVYYEFRNKDIRIISKHAHMANAEEVAHYYFQELTDKGWQQTNATTTSGRSNKIHKYIYEKDKLVLIIRPEHVRTEISERIWIINMYHRRR